MSYLAVLYFLKAEGMLNDLLHVNASGVEEKKVIMYVLYMMNQV